MADEREARHFPMPPGEWYSLEIVAAYLGYEVEDFQDRLEVIRQIWPGSALDLRGTTQWPWRQVLAMNLSRDYIDAEFLRRHKERLEQVRSKKRGSEASAPEEISG